MGDVILENIVKQYEDVTAVENINLNIKDGEFICLVGPSGCGKSTTLETIAGLTKPTSGEITVADREVTYLPPKDRQIAMVFQNIALFPHMNVHDNISFGLRLRNFDSKEVKKRVENAAEILQIKEILDRMPDELSGGQQQRVAIGRAIVRDPEVFLMDEPLANLDAKLRVHMRTELQRLHKELGTTIIYVTHDQAEAMTMADRIAVLNKGELQQIAPPLKCYNEPANQFVASFIGSPSMNFIEGKIRSGGFESTHINVDINIGNYDDLSIGDPITLGVRPEDVYPKSNSPEIQSQSDPIDAQVDVLEPMGDEIFVYLRLNVGAEDGPTVTETSSADQLLMSVDPDSDVSTKDNIELVIDREKLHLFESGNGNAITHGIGEQTALNQNR
ncbi:ABC transporter ATP-binding protein [Halobacteria archaeon AArc-curdl1]|uniref:ABC-type D-xylose/L-arabinose transporter n=1 Tax=Natronosalvus hydrolyticus TaxID=2979988 RepID=A0AAP2Z9F2_9EURY|nr:ABC transporter ATP-binding protein [Halobacteria archaeon AArc-curdl1]